MPHIFNLTKNWKVLMLRNTARPMDLKENYSLTKQMCCDQQNGKLLQTHHVVTFFTTMSDWECIEHKCSSNRNLGCNVHVMLLLLFFLVFNDLNVKTAGYLCKNYVAQHFSNNSDDFKKRVYWRNFHLNCQDFSWETFSDANSQFSFPEKRYRSKENFVGDGRIGRAPFGSVTEQGW